MAVSILFHIFAFLGNFPMRLLIPALLFMAHVPRRKGFMFRCAALLSYLIVPQLIDSFFFLPAFQTGLMNWSFMLWYAYLLLGLYLCFDISIGQLLYVGIASYVIQNVVQDVMNPVSMSIFHNRIAAYEVQNAALNLLDLRRSGLLQNQYRLLYVILYDAIMAVIYLIFSASFVLDWLDKRTLEVRRWTLVILLGAMLLILNLISYILLQGSSSIIITAEDMIHYTLECFLLALCSLLMLTLQRSIFAQTQAEKDQEFIEKLLDAERQQSQFTQDSIRLIHMKAHDLKGQMAALKMLSDRQKDSEQQKLYQSLEEAVSLYDARFHTGNDMLDILLTEKSLYCMQHDISLTCTIDGTPLTDMESADLYSLLGNALNNAIESAEKAPAPENRNISLSIRQQAGFCLIELDNYCDGAVAFRDGLPQTTKQHEAGWHGFGTQSMRYIAEKYQGNLLMRQEGNHFITNILVGCSPASSSDR